MDMMVPAVVDDYGAGGQPRCSCANLIPSQPNSSGSKISANNSKNHKKPGNLVHLNECSHQVTEDASVVKDLESSGNVIRLSSQQQHMHDMRALSTEKQSLEITMK